MSGATGEWSLDTAPAGTELETFVQWKGTDLCMDVHCRCGTSSHIDGMFAYYVKCPNCGTVYELSTRLLARVVPDADDAITVVGE
jgi:hypothetical protein